MKPHLALTIITLRLKNRKNNYNTLLNNSNLILKSYLKITIINKKLMML